MLGWNTHYQDPYQIANKHTTHVCACPLQMQKLQCCIECFYFIYIYICIYLHVSVWHVWAQSPEQGTSTSLPGSDQCNHSERTCLWPTPTAQRSSHWNKWQSLRGNLRWNGKVQWNNILDKWGSHGKLPSGFQTQSLTPRMKPTKVDRLETKMHPPSEKGGNGSLSNLQRGIRLCYSAAMLCLRNISLPQRFGLFSYVQGIDGIDRWKSHFKCSWANHQALDCLVA